MMPQSAPQPPQGGDNAEAQLVQLLTQAKAMAESKGIDFKAVVMQVMGAGSRLTPPPTPPSIMQ